MSSLLKIEWTVLSEEKLLIHRPCGRCGTLRPFVSTGKIRLNANGSRLDAWLIHCCVACGKRWNKTLFERRSVKSFSPEGLEALHSSDPLLVGRVIGPGGRSVSAGKPVEGAAFTLRVKVRVQSREEGTDSLLFIRNPSGCRVRLDQVLAKGLALPRKQIHRLSEEGRIRMPGASGKSFRRPIAKETIVSVSGKGECGEADLVGRLLSSARFGES